MNCISFLAKNVHVSDGSSEVTLKGRIATLAVS